jgi:hypothetical protein
MEKSKEETFNQKEIKLTIGSYNVELFFSESENILNMKIIERVSGLETLISLQKKEDEGFIKSVIWENLSGLLSNATHDIR